MGCYATRLDSKVKDHVAATGCYGIRKGAYGYFDVGLQFPPLARNLPFKLAVLASWL